MLTSRSCPGRRPLGRNAVARTTGSETMGAPRLGVRVYHRAFAVLATAELQMIRSMTAFASAERATQWGTLGCELRAVNHRFLELGVRLPEELRALEPALRERIGTRVARGKLDLTLRLRPP